MKGTGTNIPTQPTVPKMPSYNSVKTELDAISRQKTLDAFGLSERTRKYGGDHSGYHTMMLYEIQDVIEGLPPVNPQEPCEMTAEEYRQRMIQAFYNADCGELISVCVLPTEKEFEHLEWLLKNHYKKEPCEDMATDGTTLEEVIETLQVWIATADDEYDREEMGRVCGLKEALHEIKKIKGKESVNPCKDAISRQEVLELLNEYDPRLLMRSDYRKMVEDLPSVRDISQSKTGRWVLSGGYWRCSECKEKALLKFDKSNGGCKEYTPVKSNYCQNCGARMGVEE